MIFKTVTPILIIFLQLVPIAEATSDQYLVSRDLPDVILGQKCEIGSEGNEHLYLQCNKPIASLTNVLPMTYVIYESRDAVERAGKTFDKGSAAEAVKIHHDRASMFKVTKIAEGKIPSGRKDEVSSAHSFYKLELLEREHYVARWAFYLIDQRIIVDAEFADNNDLPQLEKQVLTEILPMKKYNALNNQVEVK